jgi:hypothetical protein
LHSLDCNRYELTINDNKTYIVECNRSLWSLRMTESPRRPNLRRTARARARTGTMASRVWPDGMSRTDPTRDRAKVAEEISWHVLDLAQLARSAGLAEICHALESVALSAAAEAEATRWPRDQG